MLLTELDVARLQPLFADMLEAGTTEATVRRVYCTLRSALNHLKTIADQLGQSSIVLTADTSLSVTIELGLAIAAATARLILRHGKRPPSGGTTRRRSPRRRPPSLSVRHG